MMLFQTVFGLFAAAAVSVSAGTTHFLFPTDKRMLTDALPVLAPLATRQVGNLQCNINRLQIVTDLSSTKKAVSQLGAADAIASSVSSWFSRLAYADVCRLNRNTTAAAAVQTVTDGINGAQGAIGVIAKALLTGQTAPAEARQEVQGNLTSAQGALNSISA
jgi:hypothetical protein